MPPRDDRCCRNADFLSVHVPSGTAQRLEKVTVAAANLQDPVRPSAGELVQPAAAVRECRVRKLRFERERRRIIRGVVSAVEEIEVGFRNSIVKTLDAAAAADGEAPPAYRTAEFGVGRATRRTPRPLPTTRPADCVYRCVASVSFMAAYIQSVSNLASLPTARRGRR